MNKNTARAIASVAICSLGGLSMWVTNGETGIGWSLVGMFVIWGSLNLEFDRSNKGND